MKLIVVQELLFLYVFWQLGSFIARNYLLQINGWRYDSMISIYMTALPYWHRDLRSRKLNNCTVKRKSESTSVYLYLVHSKYLHIFAYSSMNKKKNFTAGKPFYLTHDLQHELVHVAKKEKVLENLPSETLTVTKCYQGLYSYTYNCVWVTSAQCWGGVASY